MTSPSRPHAGSFSLTLLVLLVAGSGCAALIYEVVWYQMLQLVIGSTSVSLAFLLATFMGGLGLGSIVYPRLSAARRSNPLETYAKLEIGAGVFGLLVLFGLPLLRDVYIAGPQTGLAGMIMRGVVCALCLLIPTALMGASLPAIVRAFQSTPEESRRWGLLYGANTFGAVFGCLAAGFYFLRLYDVAVTTYIAVALNLLVAAVAFAARGWFALPPEELDQLDDFTPQDFSEEDEPESVWPIYLTTALSGACALGAEVVWTRLLGMLLGVTVYAFSILLAVFLIGLAIGSAVASGLANPRTARTALGWTQIALCGAIAWSVAMIADSLPYWPIDPMLTKSPWFLFQLDMARGLWALLPPTLLWGASMPLAFTAIAATANRSSNLGQPADSGRLVGGIYAANTFGSILGALITSLILVPSIGTQQSQRVLLILSLIAGFVILLPKAQRSARGIAAWAALAASLLMAGYLAYRVHPVPSQLVAYGRRMATLGAGAKLLYTGEGINSSIVINEFGDGSREIDVNGHVEATSLQFDMKLQRMVGHLPGILHPNPVSVLGIGFGAGVSAGTFTRYPGIKKITICEIEPIIPPASTKYFGRQNYEVFKDPRTTVRFDDARHYLMTTSEKYDIIASDPLDVFAKGTAALYTKEYFEAVKRHLNPGGYFTLYVPLYESDERTVRSELETFFAVFPNASVWQNTIDGRGYDMVFLGQQDPLKIDVDAVEARLNRPEYARVRESLLDVGFPTAYSLLATYSGVKQDLGRWSAGADLNTDRDLRLQYLGGWGINSNLQDEIYVHMRSFVQSPKGIFQGSQEKLDTLRRYGLAFE
jgi:spermidine synthase